MSRKIIAILRGVTPDEVTALAETLIEEGIDRIEVPLNSPDPLKSIERLASRFSKDALIGAGTVLCAQEVAEVDQVGGKLIVSPNCDPYVIRATKVLGMASYPGVVTPTECFAALKAGADGLKFFPADVVGPAGLKALRAVLPKATETFVVGGATPDNISRWIAAGASGFGVGSGLYRAGDSAAEVRIKARAWVREYDALGIAPAAALSL
ncbi:2-dehydro-3-deoxy-6-phosphogalactonate aldolase [Shimia biformata]|uniref:2-dehydro-3-deoxy-6-phosphogalactonate aldolase n=1 Tax=Shimia biformata TaxID=1294299 RepID=UPI00194FB498|nr:2-dehydro-3-deoxy-6-phosphogalactonate aldolase [Shimia biformata]